LAAYLAQEHRSLATSRIAVVELRRTALVRTRDPESVRRVAELLEECMLVDVSPSLLDAAAGLATAALRSLDAIHLASALEIGAGAILTYDRRQLEVAPAMGLQTISP